MNKRPYLVVIDPGHGGQDPGAINSEHKIKEKDINLSMAKLFKKEVSSGDYLYDVILTREEDCFVGLIERYQIANRAKADLFLSFHCNACEDKNVSGLEVWYYPNSKEGKVLAAEVYRDLINMVMEGHNGRGIKEGNFFVLRYTNMPAILIEFEFISNSEQALFLSDKENQRELAKQIAETVEFFLEGGNLNG